MEKTKGFVTLATGKEEYFRLALNLLRSYRYFCHEPLPFAVITDRENEYTKEFNDVLIIKDGATNSYLDKLHLGEYLPYDENIFIDSDCLAYDDLNVLFTYFDEADDFSCFGRVLPLDDETGWFEYKNLGDLQKEISYVVGLHGGIYFMRKSEMCNKVFSSAKSFVSNYQQYKFKGNFATPGDEPLIALAMAVNGCKPIPFQRDAICCYWEYVDCMKIDIAKGVAKVVSTPQANTILLHWGTRYTRELQYKKQVQLLDILETEDGNALKLAMCKIRYDIRILCRKVISWATRIKNKSFRVIGIR